MHKETITNMYLDYFNNYLTVARFAQDNGLTVLQALKVIKLGRELDNYKPTIY